MIEVVAVRRAPRQNGFEGPHSPSSVTAWAGQLLGVALSAAVLALLGEAWATAIYVPLALSTLALWLYVQSVDPAQPGGVTVPCMRESQATARYCSVCRKPVPGLDHHCVWLNTCVGKRTYAQFYALSVAGWLTAAWQLAFGVLVVADPVRRAAAERVMGSLPAAGVLVGLHLVVSGVVFGSYLSLWGFHTYLLRQGQGTYLHMITSRQHDLERKMQRAEALKKAQEEQPQDGHVV